MKLASLEIAGRPRLGFEHAGQIADLRAAYEAALWARGVADADEAARRIVPGDMTQFIRLGEAGLGAAREAAAFLAAGGAPKGSGRILYSPDEIVWLPPVPRPSKIFCVVVNNAELVQHAKLAPDHPIYYTKPTSALVGHRQPITLRERGVTHPEAEMAFVVGRTARNVSAADAYDYVFGYSILNDVTSPDVRKRDTIVSHVPTTDPKTGKVVNEEVVFVVIARHKGMDTYGPMGPWLVTKDEIPDPHQLNVGAWIGDLLVNKDHTSRLRFHVPQVIEHITKWSTLNPGDIVTLGTASTTTDWPMLDADISQLPGPVKIEIEKIGVLENPVVQDFVEPAAG